jgi:hypothetical protein
MDFGGFEIGLVRPTAGVARPTAGVGLARPIGVGRQWVWSGRVSLFRGSSLCGFSFLWVFLMVWVSLFSFFALLLNL